MHRIILFSDPVGASHLLRSLPANVISGIVAAGNREYQHEVMHELARQLGVPLLIQPRQKSPEYKNFIDKLIALSPELIVVNGYALRLPSDLLAVPARGSVNLHYGLLPYYRGNDPIQWALIRRETEIGVTLHYLSEALDAGDIIAQRRIPVALEDTYVTLMEKLAEEQIHLMREELRPILAGNCSRLPQNAELATVFRAITYPDACIHWDRPLIDIYNLIRALISAYPGAVYFYQGARVVIREFLSLQEVATLKFGPIGGVTLTAGSVRLVPWKAHDGHDPKELSFLVQLTNTEQTLGTCTLSLSSFKSRSASIRLGLSQEDASQVGNDCVRLLSGFAAHELCLDSVHLQNLEA